MPAELILALPFLIAAALGIYFHLRARREANRLRPLHKPWYPGVSWTPEPSGVQDPVPPDSPSGVQIYVPPRALCDGDLSSGQAHWYEHEGPPEVVLPLPPMKHGDAGRVARANPHAFGDPACGYDLSKVGGVSDRDPRTLQDCFDRVPETFIPLPEGKSIPVTFHDDCFRPPETKSDENVDRPPNRLIVSEETFNRVRNSFFMRRLLLYKEKAASKAKRDECPPSQKWPVL